MTTAVLAADLRPATCPPELVWKRLARLLAAPGRSRMRLWNPETGKFSDTAKHCERLPSRPAALYLYTRRRTHTLWLDFDAKLHGPAAVADDLARAAEWITQCGGVVVTDRSSSGGRHLICPLAIGTSASLDEMNHLVRLLAARLPTLDITPNTNADTGCMTPPGSPCREGGYRQLDGTLEAAVEAFTTRSEPTLLPRLLMLLGALNPPVRSTPATQPATAAAEYTVGAGDDQRISAPYVRHDPLPADVVAYATDGTINPARRTWQSNHEARQSVVVNAIARGHSLATLREMIGPNGPWRQGLGSAYTRYDHRGDQALTRDVAKAFDWLINNVLKSSPPRHKTKNSPGGYTPGPRGPKDLRDWLANAIAWADREFVGKRYRWTVHAVLQSIAFYAVMAGDQRSGTWLVGVGGRSLSLSSGLLSEDTIWRVLADLRERAGAPLVLVRHHLGTDADVYALTTQNRVTNDAAAGERIRIEPVHDAWIVLGHHLRRIYELVAHHGLTNKADIYAAAAVPRATGDAMVSDLEVAGLLKRAGRGVVVRGPVELDAIANSHQLGNYRAARLQRHQAERSAWKKWLDEREQARSGESHIGTQETLAGAARSAGLDEHTERAYLDLTMCTGPPPMDNIDIEREAIDIVADLLGGRILAA
ncbi:hypothetical protein H7J87_27850 [Mycolicibacterium wolinskyi]|uniref:Uncharacterized protein n=1 Tax=Mycolicibacterium wolinskyi TaxID=59750 RepID=A0A1X2FC03_9MYCO|nr:MULTISPECIES: hypothetical protein [Mycolicibacterium]MCV7289147.1 hypothetical protein [Mycolicibacterium wolinskyi]MCV7297308.1 hypothetical protein [Mycolicibacterium goodii]ORX15981.1 hypothetical protein AWC31_01010 [Mycolicibacterium wolinskyi]